MAVEPRLAPFVGPTPLATKPQLRGVPLIDTLAAQFDISGSPIVQQNLDHIFGKREYDPNFNVDTFLEGKALNQMEINSIKNNSATFEDATNQYERVLDNQNTQRILESSSGLSLMITDPQALCHFLIRHCIYLCFYILFHYFSPGFPLN